MYATVEVQGRDFVLVHAGVRSNGVPLPTAWDKASLEQYLSKQSENDLCGFVKSSGNILRISARQKQRILL